MKKVVNFYPKNRKAQVWIETVIYTLIAFAILGTVLAFAKPKIQQLQDRSIIDQSIKMLEDIDTIIEEIKIVPGNKRQIELGIKKGFLTINASGDQIIFNIESRYTYSEPGEVYQKGDINIFNTKVGKINKINATLNYENRYNITWNDGEKLELLTRSSNPYKLFISNKGEPQGGGLTIINFEFS